MGVDVKVITEVMTYIQNQIETTSINTAYKSFLPSSEILNVCAIRGLPGGTIQNNLNCDKNYTEQLFSVLYRGTKDRNSSLNALESVLTLLNNQSNVILANTVITHIQGSAPSFVFVDGNSIPHYNLNISVTYNSI